MDSTFDAQSKIWSGASLPYPFPWNTTVGELTLSYLSKTPDRAIQITESDGIAITCDDLRINMIRVAENLAKIGIKEDDVVGIVAPQSHLATYIIHGCIAHGALINPLSGAMSEADICGVFTQTRPKIIICQPDVIPKLQRALKNVNFDYHIYSMSTESSLFLSAWSLIKPTGTEDVFVMPKFSKPANEKTFAILCSSGTTGTPKGVCMSQATILSWAPLFSMADPTNDGVVSFSPSQNFWATGFLANIFPVFSPTETRIVPEDKPFDPKDFLETIEKYKITSVTISPRYLALLLQYEMLSSHNHDSLKKIMATGLIISKNMRDLFSEKFPDKMLTISYGMTEYTIVLTKPFEYQKEYAVGSILLPNMQVKVVNDEGNRLGVGETGEFCVKSSLKFIGYYNNAKATEDSFDDEDFFKTGDVGYFDEEGILYVVDRKKEIMKCKGHQVNSAEIENVIQTIEGVETVSVVGIQDDFIGSLITAAVVKKHGYEKLSETEIINHVASTLPHFKHLDGGVYFFDKLPITPSGKTQKRFVLAEVLKVRNHTPNGKL